MDSPSVSGTDSMNSPRDVGADIMDNPGDLEGNIMDSPSDLGTDIMDSPSDLGAVIMDSPGDLGTDIMDSPGDLGTDIMDGLYGLACDSLYGVPPGRVGSVMDASVGRTIGLVVSTTLILVTLANSLLILGAMLWRRQLRNPSNVMIICMVLPQLLQVTIQCSAIFAVSLKGYWIFSALSCRFVQVLLSLTFGASMYHQVSLALQRYLHILQNSRVLRSVAGVVMCLLVSWTLPLLPITYFLLAQDTHMDTPYTWNVTGANQTLTEVRCEEICEDYLFSDTTCMLVWSACFVFVPKSIIVFCYLSIYRRSRYFTSQLRITRRRNMNRLRRDAKLLRLCVVLVLVAVLGYGPYVAVRCVGVTHGSLALLIPTFISCLACGNSAIIYGVLHTQFRLTFAEILYMCRHCICASPRRLSLVRSSSGHNEQDSTSSSRQTHGHFALRSLRSIEG